MLRKRRLDCTLILLLAGRVCAQEHSPLELEVFRTLNRLRDDPASLVRVLDQQRRYYRGNLLALPGQTPLETHEGVRAVDEAIAALQSSHGALHAVTLSPGLTRAAREHVVETGSRGLVGHGDFAQRISRFGSWSGGIAENISYGESNGAGVIFQLLIDDGVRDRGHRTNLLDPRWRYTGIACGPHSVYGALCVMEFAVNYREIEARP